MTEESTDTVQLWLVERTYSDDEQNLIILIYATLDGERYVRKERAVTSYTNVPETTAGITMPLTETAPVQDDTTKRQYADQARQMRDRHEPDDRI